MISISKILKKNLKLYELRATRQQLKCSRCIKNVLLENAFLQQWQQIWDISLRHSPTFLNKDKFTEMWHNDKELLKEDWGPDEPTDSAYLHEAGVHGDQEKAMVRWHRDQTDLLVQCWGKGSTSRNSEATDSLGTGSHTEMCLEMISHRTPTQPVTFCRIFFKEVFYPVQTL